MFTKWYNPRTQETIKFFKISNKNGTFYRDIETVFAKLYTRKEMEEDLKLEELC